MSQFQAKVIEHSSSNYAPDLVTMQVSYPRMIHSELMTHRVFSRNASSSRAIPVAKMIEQVRNNPAMPVRFGRNQPGMQDAGDHNERVKVPTYLVPAFEAFSTQVPNTYLMGHCSAEDWWRFGAWLSCDIAQGFSDAGYHKQVANRQVEHSQIIHVIITSTEWSNFYELRNHEDADPNIQALARTMILAREESTPRILRPEERFDASGWHLPYVTQEEREKYFVHPKYLAKLSAARCARVSYLTHDGAVPDPAKDLKLYDQLVGSRPMHASPVEHQAYPDRHPVGSKEWFERDLHGNFTGWVQHRKLVEKSL